MGRRGALVLVVAGLLLGCGDRSGKGAKAGDEKVEKETIVEKTPYGTRTTVITRTTKTVEAPAPAARPADPYPSDPLVKYNVDLINGFRAKGGLAALVYDA